MGITADHHVVLWVFLTLVGHPIYLSLYQRHTHAKGEAGVALLSLKWTLLVDGTLQAHCFCSGSLAAVCLVTTRLRGGGRLGKGFKLFSRRGKGSVKYVQRYHLNTEIPMALCV